MLAGPRSERRDGTQVEADLSGLDGHACLSLTVPAPWPGPDPHGRPFSTACGLHTQPLCGFQLPTRVLGSYPPTPMDGCWSHCRDLLWDVPIEQSSQGRSAVIPTHVAGPVSFCLGAHTPGRKLWAGQAPRRKTSGCSDVP